MYELFSDIKCGHTNAGAKNAGAIGRSEITQHPTAEAAAAPPGGSTARHRTLASCKYGRNTRDTALFLVLLLSLASRRDRVKLYDTTSWESLGDFTAETVDLVSIEFSPDGCTLCLQDTSLE